MDKRSQFVIVNFFCHKIAFFRSQFVIVRGQFVIVRSQFVIVKSRKPRQARATSLRKHIKYICLLYKRAKIHHVILLVKYKFQLLGKNLLMLLSPQINPMLYLLFFACLPLLFFSSFFIKYISYCLIKTVFTNRAYIL